MHITMFIWFLHNTFGPRNRGITPLRANWHKPCGYWVLSHPQGLGRCDIWFLYNTPGILLYRSSTGLLTPLPPGLILAQPSHIWGIQNLNLPSKYHDSEIPSKWLRISCENLWIFEAERFRDSFPRSYIGKILWFPLVTISTQQLFL